MKKSILLVVGLLVLVGYVLAGCNTVRGVGKDVQKGGEAIQDVAK